MNIFSLLFLSILFIKVAHVCGISTNEVLRDKRIEFRNSAKFVINESNLVDKNEKLVGTSLRTYKYYLVKGTTEIRAIFIFDDLNMNKAKVLGIHNEQHEIDILNVQNNMNKLYPLDEISTFSDVIYKERKTFSLETSYSTTSYVLTKFVFNINIEEENDENVMSLLVDNELNMKKKNLQIKIKNDKQEGNNNSNNNNNNSSNGIYRDSNSINLYQKRHPQVFTQFIGIIGSIISLATSIPGAISAISSLFKGSPSPSPPQFLGDENSKLPTYEERKSAYISSAQVKKGGPYKNENRYMYDDNYDEDNDEYDDDYNDEYEDEYEDEYGYY
ncbi:hypothetical protein MKS88_000904 [Plasmodium brasilianum]|uniref:Uncharacterized protein n=2 Tax=Plasmodium (Plasmodium) TaxID=418103 RepID=A0A1A8VRK5_PLAMA|nr:conserved Plasmodium protein, unknown function [Plasmodium malariae]KAI4840671.1 hypothetical protein MKS88_000904 [Plasmodium brasilianum]SBS81948.1 hypothetical protein PMALA_002340 [Plasmodium malariae]SBT86236.1 conserved Plasmodium protein, unknown function [Plasmodium malariae]